MVHSENHVIAGESLFDIITMHELKFIRCYCNAHWFRWWPL